MLSVNQIAEMLSWQQKVKTTPIPGKFVYLKKRCTAIGIEAFLLSQQESLKFQL